MRLEPEAIRQRILKALPGAAVSVTDTTGGGDHFSATVVTAQFRGKASLERHRLVYAALADVMSGQIHALSLTTQTPEEREPA